MKRIAVLLVGYCSAAAGGDAGSAEARRGGSTSGARTGEQGFGPSRTAGDLSARALADTVLNRIPWLRRSLQSPRPGGFAVTFPVLLHAFLSCKFVCPL